MLERNAGLRLAPKVWIPIAWLAFALADAAKTVGSMHAEGMHHYWVTLYAVEVLSWLPWAFALPLIVWLSDRLHDVKPVLAWTGHVIAAALIGLAYTVWSDQLTLRFQPFAPQFAHWTPTWPADFYDNLMLTLVLYALALLGHWLIESRAKVSARETEVAQLNEQLAQARLLALRSQVEPHFLFNSLNALAGLIREGRADAAVQTVVQLSDFLRRTLSAASRQEVPLADEVEFARRYLTIQQTRFADRLRLDFDVQDGLQNAAVPNLILQPLVENAVKHGIAKRTEGGSVRVAASASGESLDLYVANDGPSLPDDWNQRERSIGIANVCRRLHSLYGDASSFDIRNRNGGGVEIAIRIPLRVIGSAEGRT
ncbi:MAG TPA: histidine kinase [Candidatus Eremiobacteraceae bacterium]|nr:histidine kinase [Candidatus Eremiobacteraceae bacterium]